jgi:PKD repeat protein
VGGVDNWKSTDGGVNWSIITHWSGTCSGTATALHADHHCYEWNNGNLYVGHDGGISFTNDGGISWAEITNNLAITQVYKIGQSTLTGNMTLIGTQDNGSAASVGNYFTTTRGGDGGECIIDYTDNNYCYNTYVNGKISRSTTGPTGSYSAIAEIDLNGISDSEEGAWITPYFLHKTIANTMFVGYQNVYRCTDIKGSSVSWEAISSGESSTCRVLEQSPANVDIIYAVRSGSIKRTDNANVAAGSVTWVSCTMPDGIVPVDLKAHTSDENIVYAVAGYKIYKSSDKGATWTDISGTLPNLFINCLVLDKNINEGIYIGNQTGVWYKNADMADWSEFSTDLPKVDIRELEIFYDQVGTQNRLKAATYGRGLWESDLFENGVINPINITASAASNVQINLGWELNSSGNSVILAFNTTPDFGTPVDGTSYATSTTIPGGGTVLYNGNNASYNHALLNENTTYYYKLWSYDGSTQYSTGSTANASTFCTIVNVFPYNEGFENGGTLPSCWTQEYLSGSNDWQFTSSGVNNHPASPHSGNYHALLRYVSYANENYQTRLISPPFDLTQITDPQLSFWHHQEMWAGNQDELRVYYKTAENSEWILLEEFVSNTNSWTRHGISLPNPGSTYFIAFEGKVNAGYGVCIDDVMISTPEADFIADNVISCTGNLEVNFTDKSIGPNNSWAWDVNNDGIVDYMIQNPTHTYNSPGIYSVQLTVNNGNASKTTNNMILVMNSEPTLNTACTLNSNSNNGNAFSIGIFRFALESINNVTPNNNGFYQNYSCTNWTELEFNKTYDVTIQTGTANNEGAKVYIDYNDNGDFEASEEIASFPSNTVGTRTLSFTTPSTGVVPDKGLRLRVLSKFSGVPATGCDISSYGQAEDYTVYFAGAQWNGNISNDWFATSNWDDNLIPTSISNPNIPAGCVNYPILNSNATVNNLRIETGASFTINSGVSLSVNGSLTTNGTFIINSDALGNNGSLIVEGTSSGHVIYNRFILPERWFITSAPVKMNSNFDISNGSKIKFNSTYNDYDFAPYVESGNEGWSYATSIPSVLTSGQGYITRLSAGNTNIEFNGELNKSINLNLPGTSATDGWNAIGNPYTSAIKIQGADGFITTNLSSFTPNYAAIYMWNDGAYRVISNSGYTPVIYGGGTLSDPIIQVGQGFLVNVPEGGSTINFLKGTAGHQIHDVATTLKSVDKSWLGLTLELQINGQMRNTIVCFNPEMTTGMDISYDAGLFSNSKFDVYTKLVSSENKDINLAIQCLPDNNYRNLEVPVSIKMSTAGIYMFKASGILLPENVYPILEDRLLNKFTALNGEAESYAVQLNASDKLSERFFLHFADENNITSNTSPGGEEITNLTAKYKSQRITIFGDAGIDAKAVIYDISGRKISDEYKLTNSNQNEIPAKDVTNGVYFVRVSGKSGKQVIKVPVVVQ